MKSLVAKSRFALFGGSAAAVLCGCNPYLFSPPARAVPLESPALLPLGTWGVQLEGGEHVAVAGFGATAADVRVRRSVTNTVELSGEVTWIHVGGTSSAGTDPNGYGVRAGAKYLITPWLAAAGGIGGGLSTAGSFVAPDVGLLVGAGNAYVGPFAAVRLSMSQPIVARAVDTSSPDASTGRHVYTPQRTWMPSSVVGMRIPFGAAEPARDGVHGSGVIGIGVTHLADINQAETAFSGVMGVEVTF